MSEDEKKRLYVYVLLAALLGGGGSTGLQMLSPIRADPYTGSQGAALEAKVVYLIHRIERVEKTDEKILAILNKLPPRSLIREVERLKTDCENVKRRLNRAGK